MSATLLGPRSWSLDKGDDGSRTYSIKWLVETSDKYDGPQIVADCPGLPSIGSSWDFAWANDSDPWAFCYPTLKVQMVTQDRPNFYWLVENKFSTIPFRRCQDTPIDDPLSEPDRVSGSFVKYTREAQFDRHGALLRNSAWELFRGPQVEFDANRPTVRISQNVSSLELEVFTQMVDTVNDAPMWGVATRCVKLSNVAWERLVQGSCSFYYSRTFDFDINFETFDPILGDVGTMVLNGQYNPTPGGSGAYTLRKINNADPDPDNPQHFCRYKDRFGEYGTVILNGAGLPWNGTGDPPTKTLEKYDESNFFLLGIPSSF